MLPLPPVGVEPFKSAGVAPEQMVCDAVMVLVVTGTVTVIITAVEVSPIHTPEVTTLLNQVVWVKDVGW